MGSSTSRGNYIILTQKQKSVFAALLVAQPSGLAGIEAAPVPVIVILLAAAVAAAGKARACTEAAERAKKASVVE